MSNVVLSLNSSFSEFATPRLHVSTSHLCLLDGGLWLAPEPVVMSQTHLLNPKLRWKVSTEKLSPLSTGI